MCACSIAALFASVRPAVAGQDEASQAVALDREGKYAEAAAKWRAVVKQEPRNPAAWASLGLDLARGQEYAQAVEAYQKAAALDPKLAGLQLNWGLAEFKQGHLAAAIAPFRAALAADPNNTQARTLLGLSYYGAGNFAAAVKELAPAAKADPENAELHRLLAQSCLSAKDFSCALEEFRWLLQRTPDSAATHVLMGEALDGLGRTSEAIAEFNEAAKAEPKTPNVNFGLGYLYWKSHRYEEAERAFEAELANDANHAQALAYLGDIELKNGNPEKALELLRKATAVSGNLRLAFVDMGVILTEQKKYQEALAALLRAEKLDASQPDVHYRLGRLYQAMGKTAEAQKEMARVKALHEKDEEEVSRKMGGEKQP